MVTSAPPEVTFAKSLFFISLPPCRRFSRQIIFRDFRSSEGTILIPNIATNSVRSSNVDSIRLRERRAFSSKRSFLMGFYWPFCVLRYESLIPVFLIGRSKIELACSVFTVNTVKRQGAHYPAYYSSVTLLDCSAKTHHRCPSSPLQTHVPFFPLQ